MDSLIGLLYRDFDAKSNEIRLRRVRLRLLWTFHCRHGLGSEITQGHHQTDHYDFLLVFSLSTHSFSFTALPCPSSPQHFSPIVPLSFLHPFPYKPSSVSSPEGPSGARHQMHFMHCQPQKPSFLTNYRLRIAR